MVVVDASALAAVVFGEPAGLTVRDTIGRERLTAPNLLRFELTNIARTKMLMRPLERPAITRMLETALAFSIVYTAVDFAAVLKLAVDTRLSAYDASYLWLARHLGVSLVTLDRKLAAHADGF